MGNSCSPCCRWWLPRWRLFVLSSFSLSVLDEIRDIIESVSEGFLTYSSIILSKVNNLAQRVPVSEILHHFPNLSHLLEVSF